MGRGYRPELGGGEVKVMGRSSNRKWKKRAATFRTTLFIELKERLRKIFGNHRKFQREVAK